LSLLTCKHFVKPKFGTTSKTLPETNGLPGRRLLKA
jgi:hypothetical protein